MAERITYINPAEMAQPRGYSHAVSVRGNNTTIYIGGKNGIDKDGTVVGERNLKAQTRQALENIRVTLSAAGAEFSNIVKFTVYIVQGQDPREGVAAFQEIWGNNPHLPAVTVVFVAGLGHPDWLVEIEAVAVVPE
jgi:enamine deaminase RidA (YjgF/YER057c/UK114 family)